MRLQALQKVFVATALLAATFAHCVEFFRTSSCRCEKYSARAPDADQCCRIEQDHRRLVDGPTSTGGSPITKYEAAATHAGMSKTCTTSTATSCQISGLTDNQKYSVTVRAANAKGFGLPSTAVKSTPTSAPNCTYVGPDANLQSCNLSGINLTDADLVSANLNDATLSGANLTATELSGAKLAGVVSGDLIGIPASLPSGWVLIDGYLMGLGANSRAPTSMAPTSAESPSRTRT